MIPKMYPKDNSLSIFISANSLFHFARTLPGAIIAVLVLSHGVSLQAFTLAKALQLLASALLTVPSGILADKYGRKKAIIIACFAEAAYFLLAYKADNTLYIIAEILNGIGLCFYAGAYEGWLLNLNKARKDYDFTSNILISQEFTFIAMAVASLIGASFGIETFILSSVLLCLIAGIFGLVPDEFQQRNTIKSSQIFRNALAYCINNKIGRLIMFSGIMYIGAMQLIFQFWQPFFQNIKQISNIGLGIIFSGVMFGQYVISRIIRKYLYPRISILIAVCINWLLAAIFMLIMLSIILNEWLSITALVVLLYILFNAFSTNGNSINIAIAAKYLPDQYHSTGLSIIDLAGRLLGALLLFIVTAFIHLDYIRYLWAAIAILFFIFTICVYFFFNNSELSSRQ